jgi:hypothetical protein
MLSQIFASQRLPKQCQIQCQMHGVTIAPSATLPSHQLNTEREVTKVNRYGKFLLLAAILLTTAFAVPVGAAEKVVPLSGTLQATESIAGGAPGFFVAIGSGGGIATHLGRFTITWTFTVNMAEGTGTGPLTFTAANGDQLFATAVGSSEPTNTPGVFRIQEIFTISGGTGRFLNAQGSMTTDRLTDLNTGLTSGSFYGTITSPGSAK